MEEAEVDGALPGRPLAVEGAGPPDGPPPRLNHSCTKLSFIPEKERAVVQRFTLVLCGEGASSLSRRLCTSDANEEYRPKRKVVEASDAAEPDSDSKTLFGGKGSGSSGGTSGSRKGTADFADLLQDELTTLFVPMSQNLCRVRFVLVDAFSTSLPTFSDKALSRDNAVLLLYQGTPEGKRAVDAALQGFRARVAELNFHSKHIPLVFVVCVKAGEADLEKLQEFAQTAKLHTGVPIRVVEVTDDSEDSLISTMTDIAESLQKQKAQLGGWSRVIEGNVGRRSQCGSSICAVL